MHTQTRIEAGKDRYGAHLMIDDFRCAMPSIEIAKQLAAAPALLEALEEALDRFTDNDMMPPNHKLKKWLERAEAAIAAARGN